MHARLAVLSVAALLMIAACSASEDASNADAGSLEADAGTLPTAYPMPLFRMADAEAGTSHTARYQGVVTEHGPARDNPFGGDVTPARQLSLRLVDGSEVRLYYTLPRPFSFAAFPGDQLRLTYAERASGLGASHGVRIETITGDLRLLAEDGSFGLALDEADRLGFSFTLDAVALESTPVDCGQRVRRAALASQGGRTRRLAPGETQLFGTTEAPLSLTLLDAWRIEDSICGSVPELSLGYLVKSAE